METDLKELVKISKFAGERFDLTQGSGGNTSVKLNDGSMLIKSSGISLSEVEMNAGFSKVSIEKIKEVLENSKLKNDVNKNERNKKAITQLKKAVLGNYPFPSIETFLHSSLEKFVLHIHPVAVNGIMCRKDSKRSINDLFPTAIYIDYHAPGFDLGCAVKEEVEKFNKKNKTYPNIIFLKNHGVVFSETNYVDLKFITDSTLSKIENSFQIDFAQYKLTNDISNLLDPEGEMGLISYLCEDKMIDAFIKLKKELIFSPPLTPEAFLLFGYKPLMIHEDPKMTIENFRREYADIPRVIFYKNQLFLVAKNLKKAKEMEDSLKAQLFILEQSEGKEEFLTKTELDALKG